MQNTTDPHAEPLDGDASPLVRPYVLACERERERADWIAFYTPGSPC
ncbi:hypothetical protein [Streptomyces gobiensis]|nr:hypothetical protein [Streptomyces gobiensis]UGY92825.1 hypothetical protein test1122_14685 [Streptomyces gobiensis]